MRTLTLLFVGALGTSVIACGGGGANAAPANAPGGSTTTSTTSTTAATASGGGDDGEAQAAAGAKLYADNCASCHGDKGEGTGGGPAVVGKDALPKDPPAKAKYRKVQFNTALDVAQYVEKNMPADNPGGLKPEEYWQIMAFDLKANGVPVAGKHLDEKTAGDIKLH